MCLETTKAETKEFKEQNKNKEFIICYKVYKKYNNKLYSPFFSIEEEILPGEIKSNRSRLSFDKRDEDEYNHNGIWFIGRGIHVFTTLTEAKEWIGFNEIIFKVKCYMKDFVAYNKNFKEAVFKKVYLSKKEYNKVI